MTSPVTIFSEFNIFKKLLISYVIIIVLPLMIVYVIYFNTSREILIDKVYENTTWSLELVSNGVDDVLKRMISSSLYINEDNNIQKLKELSKDYNGEAVFGKSQMSIKELEALNGIDQLIENVSLNLVGIENYITIATKSGDIFTNWQRVIGQDDRLLKDFLGEEELPSGQTLLWFGIHRDYTIGGNRDTYVITLLKNIYQYNTKYFGTISISIPEKELGILLNEGIGPNGHRLILDENGIIISSNFTEMVNLPFESLYSNDLPSSQKGYILESLINGELSLISYNRLEYMDWVIVDIQPYNELMKELKTTELYLFIAVVTSILVFFFISRIIAKSIAVPIRKLAVDMQNFNSTESCDIEVDYQINEVEVLGTSFEMMKNNIQLLLEENIKKEQRKREAELDALQAQISPHFLFNTLNAVRWMALNGDNEQVEKMVFSLGNLLRMTISNKDELITIEDEITNVEHYINIVKLRHALRISLAVDVSEDILSIKIPKLLLQPIIENSVMHGFSDTNGQGIIEILARKESDAIFLTIHDNGNGLVKSNDSSINSRKFSSIGLTNVEERLKLHFGDKSFLSLTQRQSKGATVVLKIQMEE